MFPHTKTRTYKRIKYIHNVFAHTSAEWVECEMQKMEKNKLRAWYQICNIMLLSSESNSQSVSSHLPVFYYANQSRIIILMAAVCSVLFF